MGEDTFGGDVSVLGESCYTTKKDTEMAHNHANRLLNFQCLLLAGTCPRQKCVCFLAKFDQNSSSKMCAGFFLAYTFSGDMSLLKVQAPTNLLITPELSGDGHTFWRGHVPAESVGANFPTKLQLCRPNFYYIHITHTKLS